MGGNAVSHKQPTPPPPIEDKPSAVPPPPPPPPLKKDTPEENNLKPDCDRTTIEIALENATEGQAHSLVECLQETLIEWRQACEASRMNDKFTDPGKDFTIPASPLAVHFSWGHVVSLNGTKYPANFDTNNPITGCPLT